MQALRQRRAGSEEAVEEEVEELETAIPLEESISNFWDLGAPLEGFSGVHSSARDRDASAQAAGRGEFCP